MSYSVLIKRCCGVVIGVAILGVVPVVKAATLATSLLWADSGKTYHTCSASNISAVKLKKIKIEIVASTGEVLSTNSAIPGPNQSVSFSSTQYTGRAFCRITTSNAVAIRANLSVHYWNGSYLETLALDEAR